MGGTFHQDNTVLHPPQDRVQDQVSTFFACYAFFTFDQEIRLQPNIFLGFNDTSKWRVLLKVSKNLLSPKYLWSSKFQDE